MCLEKSSFRSSPWGHMKARGGRGIVLPPTAGDRVFIFLPPTTKDSFIECRPRLGPWACALEQVFRIGTKSIRQLCLLCWLPSLSLSSAQLVRLQLGAHRGGRTQDASVLTATVGVRMSYTPTAYLKAPQHHCRPWESPLLGSSE